MYTCITHEIKEYWTHTNNDDSTVQVQNYFGWNEHFFDSEKFLTTTSQSFCLVRRKCVNNVNNLNIREFFKKIFKNVSQNYILYCSHYNTVREYHCLTLGFGFGTIASSQVVKACELRKWRLACFQWFWNKSYLFFFCFYILAF